MKIRFFYAADVYNTYPKVYVLTEDGLLYSQYLKFNQGAIDRHQVDFDSFEEEDYSFGGYQGLVEITKEAAISKKLTDQINWVPRYLGNL